MHFIKLHLPYQAPSPTYPNPSSIASTQIQYPINATFYHTTNTPSWLYISTPYTIPYNSWLRTVRVAWLIYSKQMRVEWLIWPLSTQVSITQSGWGSISGSDLYGYYCSITRIYNPSIVVISLNNNLHAHVLDHHSKRLQYAMESSRKWQQMEFWVISILNQITINFFFKSVQFPSHCHILHTFNTTMIIILTTSLMLKKAGRIPFWISANVSPNNWVQQSKTTSCQIKRYNAGAFSELFNCLVKHQCKQWGLEAIGSGSKCSVCGRVLQHSGQVYWVWGFEIYWCKSGVLNMQLSLTCWLVNYYKRFKKIK